MRNIHLFRKNITYFYTLPKNYIRCLTHTNTICLNFIFVLLQEKKTCRAVGWVGRGLIVLRRCDDPSPLSLFVDLRFSFPLLHESRTSCAVQSSLVVMFCLFGVSSFSELYTVNSRCAKYILLPCQSFSLFETACR